MYNFGISMGDITIFFYTVEHSIIQYMQYIFAPFSSPFFWSKNGEKTEGKSMVLKLTK